MASNSCRYRRHTSHDKIKANISGRGFRRHRLNDTFLCCVVSAPVHDTLRRDVGQEDEAIPTNTSKQLR